MQIAIPKYFSLYNADMQELRGRGITPDEGWTPQGEYYENVAKHFGKASACIQCGQCEVYVRSICRSSSTCRRSQSILRESKHKAFYNDS